MTTAGAAGGLVDLVPALAVMLGANVGTTLIVQLLSFDVSRLVSVNSARRVHVSAAELLARAISVGLESGSV
jgi:phosphate:Na+ symporter